MQAAGVKDSRDWLGRLKELLGPELGGESKEAKGEAGSLDRVLSLLKHVMPLLSALQPEVRVTDAVKYGYLAGNLDTVLKFDSFSLAEYVYEQPGGHNPGLRVWLYRQEYGLTLSLLLFPNVGRWQTDGKGNKVRTELLRLDLSGDEPKVWTSILDGVGEDTPWQDALVAGLVMPLG
jgi:hypothetical protein